MDKFSNKDTDPFISKDRLKPSIEPNSNLSAISSDNRFIFSDDQKAQRLGQDILKTLAYIEEHPWKTLIWDIIPFTSKIRPYNKKISNILKEFIRLGLDDIDGETVEGRFDFIFELNRYLTTLHKESDASNQDKIVCAAFMDKLYEVYDVLISNGLEDTHPGQSKKIKKMLHHLAEEYQIENGKRIINLRKIYQKIKTEYAKNDDRSWIQRALDWLNGNKIDFVPDEKYPHIKAMLADGIYLQNYMVVDHLENKNLTQEEIIAIEEELKRHPTYPDESTIRRRRWKKTIMAIAIFFALIVGIGEGMAVAVMITSIPVLPALLTFGMLGFIVNFIIFSSACQETLKKLFLWKLFKDKNGDDISWLKKMFIISSMLIAISGALAISFLSYTSASTAITTIMVGLGVSASPTLVIGLAALIAGVTAVALTCAFFVCFADFIANERHKAIWQYLKNIFLLPGYQTASLSQWLAHIIKIVTNLLVLTAMLFIFVVTCIATGGLYHQKGLLFLQQTANVNAWLGKVGVAFSKIFTGIFIDGIAVGINFSFFNFINISKFATTLRDTLLSFIYTIPKISKWLYHAIRYPSEAFAELNERVKESYANAKRKFERPISLTDGIIRAFERFSLLISAFWNSIGQAVGLSSDANNITIYQNFNKTEDMAALLSFTNAINVNSAATGIESVFEEYSSGERVTQVNHTDNIRDTAIERLKQGKVKLKSGETVPYTYNNIQLYQHKLATDRASYRRAGLHNAFPTYKDPARSALTLFGNRNEFTNQPEHNNINQTSPVK